MKHAEPQKEHAWLTSMVGTWSSESEFSMGPGQPTQKHEGTEVVRSLGGLWILCESKGEGDHPGQNIITVGYDPAKKKFVGTFVSSMMAELWIYEGSLDEAGKVLSLHAEGPSMKGDGSIAQYIDSMEIVSDKERIFRGKMKVDDGSFVEFMKTTYRRAG